MVPIAGLSRTWRPFGYWGLTVNVSLGPAFMVAVPILWPDASLVLLAQVYPMLLAAWVAAAAVRQWGKVKGAET